MIRYNVHVGENGSIMIPTTPFAAGAEIEVVLVPPEEDNDDDDWPNPTDEQLERMVSLCHGALAGMTREEFDQLREERIMGVRQ